jgi:uncharacterized protein YggE
VDKVADLVDAATNAGANQVQDVRYSVENLLKLRAQAREKAFKAAREKAQQLAKLSGVKLGRVVSVTDDPDAQNNGWWYGNSSNSVSNAAPRGKEMDESTDNELSQGQVSTRVKVDVVFMVE